MGSNSVFRHLMINRTTISNSIVFPAFQAKVSSRDDHVAERSPMMYGKIAERGSSSIKELLSECSNYRVSLFFVRGADSASFPQKPEL